MVAADREGDWTFPSWLVVQNYVIIPPLVLIVTSLERCVRLQSSCFPHKLYILFFWLLGLSRRFLSSCYWELVTSLEVTLGTASKLVNMLELQVASNGAELAVRVGEWDVLWAWVKIVEEKALSIPANICGQCPRLYAAKAACYSVRWLSCHRNLHFKTCRHKICCSARRWVDWSMMQLVSRSNVSLMFRVKVAHTTCWTVQVRWIKSDMRTSGSLGLKMIKNFLEIRYESNGLQLQVVIYDSRNVESNESLHVACECLGEYRRAFLS